MRSCEVFASSLCTHLSQVYTGLSLLAANGEIRLTQSFHEYVHKGRVLCRELADRDSEGLFVVIDNEKVIFYETNDDGNRLFDEPLEFADAYFKRSYCISAIPVAYRHKVFPLGLNYCLHAGGVDRYEWARSLHHGKDLVPTALAGNIAHLLGLHFRPTTANMASAPVPHLEPKVLFMARTWEPDEAVSAEKKAQRIHINETRACVIRALRRELGRRFCGGFAHTRYAMENFGDALLTDARLFRKKTYLTLVREHPICIATTGLHGSIGWKMGEYVAFSRAIVSERLNYLVPYGFGTPANYLEFDTPERCVEQTMRLVEDRLMRQRMMEDNWHYYQTCLRPDKLVSKTLDIAAAL